MSEICIKVLFLLSGPLKNVAAWKRKIFLTSLQMSFVMKWGVTSKNFVLVYVSARLL